MANLVRQTLQFIAKIELIIGPTGRVMRLPSEIVIQTNYMIRALLLNMDLVPVIGGFPEQTFINFYREMLN